MIAIIDYGMGNLQSIQNMLFRIGADNIITPDKNEIKKAQKLVLPGVGAFQEAMTRLNKLELTSLIRYKALQEGSPIIGICLGMQLLSSFSEEGGHHEGLGLIEAETIRFKIPPEFSTLKIPHMGWNTIAPQKSSKLLDGLGEDARFYFVHSYHVECSNRDDILATTNYGIEFVSMVQRDNIYATQFHPEKSHKYGMQLLKNFNESIH